MSNSERVRVKRGPPPPKPIKRRHWRDAFPELLRDFGGRCPYSMQHQERAGPLEVDHFDPRKKKALIQDYNNLFPASRHCNGKKADHWPKEAEAAAGCRFLNPCEEVDYGEQILEDRVSHRVVGMNPAAQWHIRMCGLNAEHLVAERAKRAEYWGQLKTKAVCVKGSLDEAAELIESFRKEVELMIPEIQLVEDR